MKHGYFNLGIFVLACFTSACSPAPGTPCATGTSAAEGCEPPPVCGGIAAIACPGMGACVDNPNDSCDPTRGGADCSGLCQCNVRALCVQGYQFDASPAVCACVPANDPCATVRCRAGTHCEATSGAASCVPDANPCAAILCATGTTCVVRDGKGYCVEPTPPVTCGENTCASGQYCCNSSCGICAPIGAACIQIACD